MSVRVAVLLAVASAVGLTSAAALAKPGHAPPAEMLRSASISGPGLDEPVDHDGGSRAAGLLARHSGLRWVLERGEPLAVISPPLPSERGPRLEVVYRLTAAVQRAYGLQQRVVSQYLYPYARTRPWAYLPAGQGLAVDGWWPVSTMLVRHYDLVGLPPEGRIDGHVARAGAGQAAAGPAGGTPWVPGAIFVALAAVALAFRARRGSLSPRT
jgi:hypothetical protein